MSLFPISSIILLISSSSRGEISLPSTSYPPLAKYFFGLKVEIKSLGQPIICSKLSAAGNDNLIAAIFCNFFLSTKALVKCVVPTITLEILSELIFPFSKTDLITLKTPSPTFAVVTFLSDTNTLPSDIITPSVLVPPTSTPICIF